MKKAFTIFILAAFTMQTFSKAVVAGWFYLNQNRIAATLCENRDKPSMNCCGKCQLHKAIANEDKKQQKDPLLKYENKSELFCNESVLFSTPPITLSLLHTVAVYTPAPVHRSYGVFKPPC